jgi:hypothetical protein
LSYPSRPLTLGAHGPQISRIQLQLNTRMPTAGERLHSDGMFGPKTAERVRQFQVYWAERTGKPLPADGRVDAATYAALFGASPEAPARHPLLAAAIDIARTQIGVSEQPPGSNRGPEVDAYLRAAGLNPRGNHAWCAAFVYWVFLRAAATLGAPAPLPQTAGVQAMWRGIGERQRLRIRPAEARADPGLVEPGMLFFLAFAGGLGHVGLVTGVHDGQLTTIEGNTGQVSGSREGTGVFQRTQRRVADVSLGVADVSRAA